MAQKLEQDLNIIQNSGIEIQLDPLTSDLDIIQKLDDEPNDVGGLSAQQLKAKFDEAGNIIKTFINDSLIPQVLGDGLSEQTRQENEQVRQANEQTRQENEAARVAAEAAREEAAAQLNQNLTESVNQLEEDIETAEAARNVWEDYDPQKNYVPGNKVYYLGSSYVNKVACTDVLPTVAANWQIVAKKGADSDEGMSQDEADLRYLQLSGGRMTGELRVQPPQRADSPATREYVDSAPPGGFRHMVIFQESGTFDPEDYGLKVGDVISVTAVGGGGGGGVNYSSSSYQSVFGGDAGENGSGGGSPSAPGRGGEGYGGGGGGAPGSPGYPGGGGGGSGYVVHLVLKINSLFPVPVTVGTPGIGSKFTSPSFVEGSNGGASSFGTFVTANGGELAPTSTNASSIYSASGGNGWAKGGSGGVIFSNGPELSRGGMGGRNGSNGADAPAVRFGNYNGGAGGGGGGGYIIPFSALEVETIGELVPGAGVVVVYW